MVSLHDASLRDGQHAVRHQLCAEAMAAYATAIDATGVSTVEVGHGNGLAASSLQVGRATLSDRDMLRAVRPCLKSARLGVFFLPGWARISDIEMALDEGAEVIRVSAHCTEPDLTFRYLEFAAKAGMQAHGILLMSHMATPDQLARAARGMADAGATATGIFDSSGHFLPSQVTERIGMMAAAVKLPIIFHAHDNLGLAVANSLAAAQAGARIIDACALGFGAGAGNGRIEQIVPVLERAGFETGIELYSLLAAVGVARQVLTASAPEADEISIVSGLAGVFSGFKGKVIDAAERHGIDPRDLFFELGRRKAVAGQEDLIEIAAKALANGAAS
jgi:4-hydroxy 2-oxovalerate aldolase